MTPRNSPPDLSSDLAPQKKWIRRVLARIFKAAAAVLFAFPIASSTATAASMTPQDGSEDRLWRRLTPETAPTLPGWATPEKVRSYQVFRLDEPALLRRLERAPMEVFPAEAEVMETGRAAGARAGLVLTLPTPDAAYQRFRVVESPILSEELSAFYPELKTFLAQGIDDPTAIARLDHTPAGFHAFVISENGAFFVNPYQPGDTEHYISFVSAGLEGFECLVTETEGARAAGAREVNAPPSGARLSTYRLALNGTKEYTAALGGVAAAQAQMTTTVNRVTLVYEREVAIRLRIVRMNPYDAATDPFTTGGTVNGTLLTENQNDLDGKLGNANYDIGHVFSTLGGGLASVGVVCTAGSKGRGASGSTPPSGDPFDLYMVVHEVGHQFGANHTFNSTSGFCGNAGQRNAGTAYEPGSGSTIMAYSSFCAPENVKGGELDDTYFHTISFDEITNYRDGGGAACAARTNTGNTPPDVNAGANFTIPRATPFTLTAIGNDPDRDPLTFCWEEFDLGNATPPPNNANGPLFRSRLPTTSPSRTLPLVADILSGAATPWERLPTVNRTLNFRITARDNRAGGGGVNRAAMVVTVNGDPFRVTAPNGGALECGKKTTVTWDVGGGNVAANVRILFSTDGGKTFTALVANTPNDGSEDVTLPCNFPTSVGRIKVEAVGNIFFDISHADSGVQNPSTTLSAGNADHVGIVPTPGSDGDAKVVLSGSFTFAGNLNLKSSTVKIESVINELAGAGELLRGLPRTLTVPTDGSATDAVFRTTTGRPTFRLHIQNKNPNTGFYVFDLTIERGTIPSPPQLCGNALSTNLTTSFTINPSGARIVVSTVQPWSCRDYAGGDPRTVRFP